IRCYSPFVRRSRCRPIGPVGPLQFRIKEFLAMTGLRDRLARWLNWLTSSRRRKASRIRASSSHGHRSRPPQLEPLEARTVMSATVFDPNLEVRTVVAGLNLPTSMAFLSTRDASDFLVLEKNSGRVERVTSGFRTTVLDLAVNNFSERGLLGIALHPDFFDKSPKTQRYVYLYW